jgi:hypothetical protein
MTLKNWTSLILLTCVFASPVLQAKEPLWLTSTNKHGDCVSSQISTRKSTFEREVMDKTYCSEQNTHDVGKIANCLKNLNQQQTVRSLIDYCGDGIMYIGINGETYPLNRVSKAPKQHPYLAGQYEGKTAKGDALKVEIFPTQLIKKTYQDDTSSADDNIMDFQMEVIIKIKQDKQTRKFIGLLDESI